MKFLWIMMITVIVVILTIFFYAYIYYPIQEAPELVNEVNEDYGKNDDSGYDDGLFIKTGEHLDDVVIYTFNRNNPQALQRFMLDYNGMGDESVLDKKLQNNNFIEVLRALWSEPEQSKRLGWLKKKESDSYPLLLFELAVEVVSSNPSLQNFQESLYLLEIARYRTDLDAVCVNDSSARVAAHSLYQTYSKVIAEIVSREPSLRSKLTTSSMKSIDIEVLNKVLVTLKNIEKNLDSLPSQEWVSSHALKKLLSNREILASKKQCHQKRAHMIAILINEVSNKIKSADVTAPIVK